MVGVEVSVPIVCFRKGRAREFLETEMIPPPSTCYGFLLSLVGETDRRRHLGARVTASMISQPETSVVLRRIWRVKALPLGSPANSRPDFQQLLCGARLVIWLDSSQEEGQGSSLESRVQTALDPDSRGQINRFGGLSLGESTHLVDEVKPFEPREEQADCFLTHAQGRLALPVWVDHVGSRGTKYVRGNIARRPLTAPEAEEIPVIQP